MNLKKKKIAVITGASSGMGREIARQICLKLPAIDEIWLIARRKERLMELSAEINTPCMIIDGDLTENATIERYEAMLTENNVGVKILVNASGYGIIGSLEEDSLEDSTGMVRLNCEALVAITKVTIPYMCSKSRIINFASSAAFIPQPGFAVYAAGKSFVLSFSRAINQELRRRQIYVTAVCPGPVDTEFFERAEKNCKRAWYKQYFMSDCKEVACKALDDSIARRQLSVYGIGMKCLYIVSKIIPIHIILWILGLSDKITNK